MGFLVYTLILCVTFLESSSVKGGPTDSTTIFDVTKFGAVGDGKTNDAKAFQAAWIAACNGSSNSNTVIVPSGKTFLTSPITFQGPCKSTKITFEILGTIIAQPKQDWENVKASVWLLFQNLQTLSVIGNGQGTIDGQGNTWWGGKDKENESPTALKFSDIIKFQVSGLKHKDSQKNHIAINECNNAIISSVQINAPELSPNTDGIDISSSSGVQIQDCIIQTGDDCIAINGGTTNLFVSRITYGPGHGISVGSLGKDGKHEEVEGIHVDNCTFVKTQNGVRIKTWQGGSGFAKNITFSNIILVAANNPVIINQFYCVHQKCDEKENASAVQISDVKYLGIHGTSIRSNGTVNFSCSQAAPCTGIIINDLKITSVDPGKSTSTICINAHGKSNLANPPVDCLQP